MTKKLFCKYSFYLSMLLMTGCTHHYPEGKHLFLLTGQSNMERLDPEQSFIPEITKEFGPDNVIVVKEALGSQQIFHWYKNWKSSAGRAQENSGDLYDKLMARMRLATEGQPISTITLVWMQGEADAVGYYDANVYEQSMLGLYAQLQQDLHRQDIYWVIGRISDFDMHNTQYKRWTQIRDIQVKVAESNPRFSWVDTDDLNDGIIDPARRKSNDLHYSDAGYQILGHRFAQSAIKLIQ
jgi:hypothetical protein